MHVLAEETIGQIEFESGGTRFSIEISSMFGTVRVEITSKDFPDNDRVLIHYLDEEEFPRLTFFDVHSNNKMECWTFIDILSHVCQRWDHEDEYFLLEIGFLPEVIILSEMVRIAHDKSRLWYAWGCPMNAALHHLFKTITKTNANAKDERSHALYCHAHDVLRTITAARRAEIREN